MPCEPVMDMADQGGVKDSKNQSIELMAPRGSITIAGPRRSSSTAVSSWAADAREVTATCTSAPAAGSALCAAMAALLCRGVGCLLLPQRAAWQNERALRLSYLSLLKREINYVGLATYRVHLPDDH